VPQNLHTLGNYLEASLWGVIALSLLVASIFHPRHRSRLLLAALTFLLFGLSDLVEISTGAWWRPTWLLLWKAASLLSLLLLWLSHRRSRNAQKSASNTTHLDS